MAATQVIASEDHPSTISAHAGTLVWSSYDASARAFRLKLYANGRVETLPVRPRGEPFDVDLGPGPDGETVAVYSRCRREEAYAQEGCDLFLYDLATRRETKIARASTRRASELEPAIWEDRLAFVRETGSRLRFNAAVHPSVRVVPLGRRGDERVHGGPRGRSEEVSEVELHGHALAYVWYAIDREDLQAAAFAAVDVTTVLQCASGAAPAHTVERRRYVTFGPAFLGLSFERGRLYYGYDTGRESEIRRVRRCMGTTRQRMAAPEPLVSTERARGAQYFLVGEDREASSGQPCSIGSTDVIVSPSRPRTCTIGRLTGARFR